MTDDLRDELPADLDPTGFAGAYEFPDNSRRRWPGVMYLVIAVICAVIAVVFDDAVIVNGGWVVAAILLAVVGVYSITSGWRMHFDETQALVVAQDALGFTIGYASAQQVWRGLRSRPTWRLLCYSADEPPTRRGFVLVDAIDGRLIECLAEDNPEVTLEAR